MISQRQFFYQPNIIKKMDSLMFTFNADQANALLNLVKKSEQTTSKVFKRRATSLKSSNHKKNKKYSQDNNQLFQNSYLMNQKAEESPEKAFNMSRIKNSSLQIQEKKKLRNIIDNMLGKNFEASNTPKFDSISVNNRRSLNKHRTYLNQTKNKELKQKLNHDKQYKQNQLNVNNITQSNNFNVQENQQNCKRNLKPKKFQFANIKLNKANHQTQRYPHPIQDDSIELNYPDIKQMRRNDISRQSAGGQSLSRKGMKSKIPKIMYPQSDSKLPSVFRPNYVRVSIGESKKKRSRILSAHVIQDKEEKTNQSFSMIQRKRTIQNPIIHDESKDIQYEPQSSIIGSRQYSSSNQKILHFQFNSKRILLEANQELNEDISKKLGSIHLQNPNLPSRASTRTKSTHANYLHRKLREINSLKNDISQFCIENKAYTKNQSQHSRQTAEESNIQSSADQTLQNLSDKFGKSTEAKEFGLGMGLGYSVTFQVQKK